MLMLTSQVVSKLWDWRTSITQYYKSTHKCSFCFFIDKGSPVLHRITLSCVHSGLVYTLSRSRKLHTHPGFYISSINPFLNFSLGNLKELAPTKRLYYVLMHLKSGDPAIPPNKVDSTSELFDGSQLIISSQHACKDVAGRAKIL